MSNPIRFGILVLFFVLAPASRVFAFSIQNPYYDDTHKYVSRWPVSDLTYYIDSRAVGGSDISAAESQAIMDGAFQEWEDINCSSLTFAKLGNSSSQDVLPITYNSNGKNELVWVSGSTECKAWTFGDSALGVTLPMQDYFTGQITEADIAFNNCNYYGKWVKNRDYMQSWGDDISFYGVAIHEIGHFFGQQHTWLEEGEYSSADWSEQPTMAPFISPYGASDDLNADDKLGACFLYPDSAYYSGNKGFYKCTKTAECPRVVTHDSQGNEMYDRTNFSNGYLLCSGGYCQGVFGSSPGVSLIGVFCTKGLECDDGICADLGDGFDRCTRICNVDNDMCPSGYHCESSGGQEICVQGSLLKGIGETCLTKSDCESDYCFKALDGSRTCRKLCRSDSACKSTEYCWMNMGNGGCFPDETVDLKDVGEYCTAGDQCETGLCKLGTDGMTCRKACAAAGTCPDGFFCNVQIGSCMPGDEVVEPELKEEGVVCGADDECRSGLCFAPTADETHYCRVECDVADWFCPTANTACVAYDVVESGVCMPVDDRGVTGDPCTAPAQCVSGICLGTTRDDIYCSQACVDDWCPDGYRCAQAGSVGKVCLKVYDNGDADEDGETSGGCTAGTDGSPIGIVSALMLLIGAMLAFRGRRRSF